VAPGVLSAVVASAATGHASSFALATGVVWAAVVTAAVFLPRTALLCVNGPAYPNERRFPLAPPGALLLGPLELAWAVLVGLPAAALLLLAAGQWALGAILAALSVPLALVLARALHRLSLRWFVFVPAGVVVHDPMALGDPVLFPRKEIETLTAGNDGLDLTLGALRNPLELRLRREAKLALLRGRQRENVNTSALLVAPSTPGGVLAYAAGHHLPVRGAQRAVPPPRTTSPS
jgi:hypothetical protein